MITMSKYLRLGKQPLIFPHIQRRAKATMSAETQSEIEFLLNDNIRWRKFSGSQQENTAHWARDAPEKRWTRLGSVFHTHHSVTKQLNGFPSASFFPKKCFPFEWGRVVFFFIRLPRTEIRGALRMRSALPRSVSSPAAPFWRQGLTITTLADWTQIYDLV